MISLLFRWLGRLGRGVKELFAEHPTMSEQWFVERRYEESKQGSEGPQWKWPYKKPEKDK